MCTEHPLIAKLKNRSFENEEDLLKHFHEEHSHEELHIQAG